jgi:WD40 repeat protein
LQQDLEAIAGEGDEGEGREYWEELGELHWNIRNFNPGEVPSSLGEVNKVSNREFKREEIFNCEEIFNRTMEADSMDMFIPCVVNLGKKFAVAHPTKQGEPSRAIDIYEFPGQLKHTLTDHVAPVYDMCATPDGKLAVLSDGVSPLHCSVKLFDAETGYISSTCDIDVAKPCSLGVTLAGHYVILGDDKKGWKQITVTDTDGVVEQTSSIKPFGIVIPSWVTCSRSCIFVTGKEDVLAFKMDKYAGLEQIQDISNLYGGARKDVIFQDHTATVWDDFFLAAIFENTIFFEKFQNVEKQTQLTRGGHFIAISGVVTGADKEVRISARDDNLVVTHGQTIKVYKI